MTLLLPRYIGAILKCYILAMRGSYKWNAAPPKERVIVNKFDQRGIPKKDCHRFTHEGRPPIRSWTAMELAHRYRLSLSLYPDNLELNHPFYQPEVFLVYNQTLDFNQEVFQCNHCKTVVTWHPKGDQEDCPFCNRSLKNNATILRNAPLKGLLPNQELTLDATF